MKPRMSLSAVIGVAILLPAMGQAKAVARMLLAPLSPTQQVIASDVIVTGKVVELEAQPVTASDKVAYTIAVIKIADNVKGANGLTAVRVGFVPPAPNLVNPMTPLIRRPGPAIPVTLGQDQEGCFFLSKHPDGDFFIIQPRSRPLDKKLADFDKAVDNLKKIVKILEDPKAALKAKEASDRQLAACVMVQKYRTSPPVVAPNTQVVQQPIDAAESALILKTLGEMSWDKVEANGASLQRTFYLLALQPKDGWTQPRPVQGQDYNKVIGDEAQKWLNANAEKYRIQQQVAK